MLFPRSEAYSTPNIVSLFQDRKVTTTAEVLALVDDEKGPLDRVYIEACLRDARINVHTLLTRMSQRMDLRDMFPDTYTETDDVRDGFRKMVDQIMGLLGFGPVQSAIAVIKM